MSEPEVQPAATLPVPSNSIDRVFSPANFLTVFTPLIADANALTEQANRAEIIDLDTFNKGVDAVKICITILKRIDEARRSVTDPVTARIKWWNAEVAKLTEAMESTKKIFSDKTLAWKKIEDKRREEEAAAERKRAEEQALAEAEAAQKAGDTARAEKLIDLAASTPQQETQVKGRGSYTGASGGSKFTWKGEVASIKELCAAIAAGQIPEDFIKEVSKSKLNMYANGLQKEGTFFGIKVFEQEDLNVR